ncbi:hypothetical protein CEUSTIGMA_g9535.t1 [Chlamydomonas eustigma]|uniref:Patatin n=1 Tax=Chlamydomonas eustigma TaxID=1157962 RepID=A0A250XGA4_9CHLO|nr:hypothetical protein CEUSTIGMA_g9535.t1 [Chlamydomonas eustigma]|eukprot:GAX82107.1 hypothetical protein CEUSTIGMA_g9535.t1 [Chlamydomonas eustigma]
MEKFATRASSLWASTDLSHPTCIENAHPVRLTEAIHRGSIGFSFSGGGFLLPYYLGNIRALRRIGLVKAGGTHVGGSSAGSLAAAVIACGLSIKEVLPAVRAMMADCREKGVFRRLGPRLRSQLEAILPEDAHIRCTGITHIAITKVKPYGGLHSKRVSQFDTREDLLDALVASCHLPFLSNGSLTTRFHGRSVMDGGFTDFIPVPTEPHHVVKITCLPLANIDKMLVRNKDTAQRYIALSPCRFRKWPFTTDQTFKLALSPGPESFIDFLFEAGEADVMTWLETSTSPALAHALSTASQKDDSVIAIPEAGHTVTTATADGMHDKPPSLLLVSIDATVRCVDSVDSVAPSTIPVDLASYQGHHPPTPVVQCISSQTSSRQADERTICDDVPGSGGADMTASATILQQKEIVQIC